MKPSLEFSVAADETNLVVDTAHAAGGDLVDRVTVAPIDGTPRFRIVIALQREAVSDVMKAVMRALDEKSESSTKD